MRVRAAVLERNPIVGRKVARVLVAAGLEASVVEDPASIGEADVVCADVFDGEAVAGRRGILWTAEPIKRALRFVDGNVCDVLGRKDFETAPRGWELLACAKRLLGEPLPASAFVDWGGRAVVLTVGSTADRDPAVEQIQDFVLSLAVPRRIAEMYGEVAHELIMNALYVGNSDRKAHVVLDEPVTARIATDGTRLALTVSDPFGKLGRHHVVDGLARGLTGEMDTRAGGAGLGLRVVHDAASIVWFSVEPDRATEVTAVLELDLNLRELRAQPRSLHVWAP